MPSVIQKMVRFWIMLWSPENLDTTSLEPTQPDPSLMGGLFSSEDLPESPPEPEDSPTGPSSSFLGWLFSRENLPQADGPPLDSENQSKLES